MGSRQDVRRERAASPRHLPATSRREPGAAHRSPAPNAEHELPSWIRPALRTPGDGPLRIPCNLSSCPYTHLMAETKELRGPAPIAVGTLASSENICGRANEGQDPQRCWMENGEAGMRGQEHEKNPPLGDYPVHARPLSNLELVEGEVGVAEMKVLRGPTPIRVSTLACSTHIYGRGFKSQGQSKERWMRNGDTARRDGRDKDLLLRDCPLHVSAASGLKSIGRRKSSTKEPG